MSIYIHVLREEEYDLPFYIKFDILKIFLPSMLILFSNTSLLKRHFVLLAMFES